MCDGSLAATILYFAATHASQRPFNNKKGNANNTPAELAKHFVPAELATRDYRLNQPTITNYRLNQPTFIVCTYMQTG